MTKSRTTGINVISLVILTFSILSSCSFLDWIVERKNWSHKDEYIGEYQLNVSKSELGVYTDKEVYRNLVLAIKDDETFTFSFDVPFITITQGQWRMAGDDISSQCELLYERKYSYDQVHVDNTGSIYIEHPRGKKGQQKAKRLRFDRLR